MPRSIRLTVATATTSANLFLTVEPAVNRASMKPYAEVAVMSAKVRASASFVARIQYDL